MLRKTMLMGKQLSAKAVALGKVDSRVALFLLSILLNVLWGYITT